MTTAPSNSTQAQKKAALKFVLLIGVVSFFADFDFSLAAYHFEKAAVIPKVWVPIFYSVAMAISGIGSLVFGRIFDRAGFRILLPLTLISALSTPLLFLGDFRLALISAAVWGLGMGVHESIIPAAVATMVPAKRRPSAYGIFTAGYGVFWFLGSALIGILYDVSLPILIAFSVVAELAAIPLFMIVQRKDGAEDR